MTNIEDQVKKTKKKGRQLSVHAAHKSRAARQKKQQEEMLQYGFIAVTELARLIDTHHSVVSKWVATGKLRMEMLGVPARQYVDLESVEALVHPQTWQKAKLGALLKKKTTSLPK